MCENEFAKQDMINRVLEFPFLFHRTHAQSKALFCYQNLIYLYQMGHHANNQVQLILVYPFMVLDRKGSNLAYTL